MIHKISGHGKGSEEKEGRAKEQSANRGCATLQKATPSLSRDLNEAGLSSSVGAIIQIDPTSKQ